MRLNNFTVGNKVYMPSAPYRCGEARYSTIRYIGKDLTVLQPEFGEEFTNPSHTDGFEHFFESEKIQRLREIALDLYTAIRDADKNYLAMRTPHMQTAMAKFEDANV